MDQRIRVREDVSKDGKLDMQGQVVKFEARGRAGTTLILEERPLLPRVEHEIHETKPNKLLSFILFLALSAHASDSAQARLYEAERGVDDRVVRVLLLTTELV
jgi:hypothetical protein